MEADFGAAVDGKQFGHAASVGRHFQIPGAAQQGEDFALGALGIGLGQLGHFLASHPELEGGGGVGKQGWAVGGRKVGNQVAEAVHLQHQPLPRLFIELLGLRDGQLEVVFDGLAELLDLHPLGEVGGAGGKDVAPVKGVADRLAEIVLAGDVIGGQGFQARVDEAEHAVVGRQEVVPVAAHQDGPPLRAHAGVNHHQVDGARRKGGPGLRQSEGRVQDVIGQDVVADVNDFRFGIDPQDDALHGCDVVVGGAEVGQQGDDWACHGCRRLPRVFSGRVGKLREAALRCQAIGGRSRVRGCTGFQRFAARRAFSISSQTSAGSSSRSLNWPPWRSHWPPSMVTHSPVT